MPVQPNEIWILGSELSKKTDSEAALRAAVGRVYYALFLTLRGLFFPGQALRRRTHDEVEARLGKEPRSGTQQQYRALRVLREEADYQPETDGWVEKALKATRLYRHVLDDLTTRQKMPRS